MVRVCYPTPRFNKIHDSIGDRLLVDVFKADPAGYRENLFNACADGLQRIVMMGLWQATIVGHLPLCIANILRSGKEIPETLTRIIQVGGNLDYMSTTDVNLSRMLSSDAIFDFNTAVFRLERQSHLVPNSIARDYMSIRDIFYNLSMGMNDIYTLDQVNGQKNTLNILVAGSMNVSRRALDYLNLCCVATFLPTVFNSVDPQDRSLESQ